MTLDNLLLQNPVVSVIVVLAVVIPVIWKIFDVLYKKPRDFQIQTLEKKVGDLRDEILRIESTQRTKESEPPGNDLAKASISPALTEAKSVHAASPSTQLVNPTKQGQEIASSSNNWVATLMEDTNLKSLPALWEAWRNEKMTDLQKDHFEKTYIGRKVNWDVLVDSVKPTPHGRILLFVQSPLNEHSNARAAAVFDESSKDRLLGLSKNQRIKLSGKIEEFFLSPKLIGCDFIS